MSQYPPPMANFNTGGMKPHRGTMILILGIVGIVLCMPCGIAAIIMGGKDLKEMDAGVMDPSGRGQTNAGKICGFVSLAVFAIGLILNFTVFAATGNP